MKGIKKIIVTLLVLAISGFSTTAQAYVQDNWNVSPTRGTVYVSNLKTQYDLETYAKAWLKDRYGETLNIPVYLTSITPDADGVRILGNFYYYTNGKPAYIEINETIQDEVLIEKTLIHELTHYHLYRTNQVFEDGTASFSQECLDNGGATEYSDGWLISHVGNTQDTVNYELQLQQYWQYL